MKFTPAISIAVLLAGTALAITVNDNNSQDSVMNAAAGAYPRVDASLLSAFEWRFVGPNRGGRVVAVAGIPEPLVYYFGAAHGGVWKTNDTGLNWRNVSDDFIDFPAIGALDVSLAHADVIFAGTGEGLQRRFISPGNGFYKSTDDGASWEPITRGIREKDYSWVIGKDPVRPGLLHAGTETGAYVSFDDGGSWQSLQNNLHRDENQSSPNQDRGASDRVAGGFQGQGRSDPGAAQADRRHSHDLDGVRGPAHDVEPPGLTEKLNALSGAVSSGDAKPAESMFAVFEDVSERFQVQRSRLNQIIELELEALLSHGLER